METCIPVNGHPTDIREITDGYGNASNPTLDDLIARGRRIYQPATQPGVILSHWEDDGRVMRQVVDEAKTQEQLAQEASDAAIEAALDDLRTNGERYVAENEYILLCDAIAGTPGAHTRLGLGDLQAALIGLISTAPARQNAIFQYLMGLQIALQRLGGVSWWDNCTWHDHPAIVTAAGERHGAIMAVMP